MAMPVAFSVEELVGKLGASGAQAPAQAQAVEMEYVYVLSLIHI